MSTQLYVLSAVGHYPTKEGNTEKGKGNSIRDTDACNVLNQSTDSVVLNGMSSFLG